MQNFWNELPKPFFILAPMEAVTDVVFRHVVNQAGRPDVFFTEFTNTASYCSPKGIHSTRGRLAFTPDEQPMVAQIWGKNPDHFRQMAHGLKDLGFAGIDINMGCPDKSVVHGGAGSGLIRTPDLAAEIIAATKEAGLPVSVKTRLGDYQIDEWRDWLAHILRLDVVNLTIHLRTRKEMSKVDAHYELIPEIKQLRDDIAPQTLLTINGDIRDRQHGLELVDRYGVDGIMIGRGIFANPFAFALDTASIANSSSLSSEGADSHPAIIPQGTASRHDFVEPRRRQNLGVQGAPQNNRGVAAKDSSSFIEDNIPAHTNVEPSSTTFPEEDVLEQGEPSATGVYPVERPPRENVVNSATARKPLPGTNTEVLLDLLHFHLDEFDRYSVELEPRKYDPLKRFFKIYVRDFPGASELREQLMHTKTTGEARSLLANFDPSTNSI